MIAYIALAIISCAAFENAKAADLLPVYNYKVTEMYADLLSKMPKGIESRLQGQSKFLEKYSTFNRVANEYFNIIALAKRTKGTVCSPAEHTVKLETSLKQFNESRKACMDQADCKINLDTIIDKIFTTIQMFDDNAKKEETACKDDACKLQVYDKTHQKFFQLYKDSMPTLKVAQDQDSSNPTCFSALIDCMVSKNGDNLKQLYAGVAKLADCILSSTIKKTTTSNMNTLSDRQQNRLGWYTKSIDDQ